MRLKLSREAQADLDAIRDYSIEQFDIPRAIAYLDAVERAFRRILTYPEIGLLHPALPPDIRSLSCEQHRIFYVIEGDGILIVRILHKAMDAERWLD